ncbi:hypothetical protein O181_014989 [Austropuccinia psidii MF-1]|uniref:Integrase catalytic domain-containing protein n=1 Tax=Austropuccinia psidii MF-1 TaxID=1389203 RepID=A0A9Q3BZ57_9BASI|nr:hypothetical protein [Austropuccinia psidii MF-1]
MENWHNRKLKKLVSDRGGKFLNKKLKNNSNECGFTHKFSPPETPEHSGYAERSNSTAVIHSLKIQWDWKLAPPGQEGVLLGFENGNTAYQILILFNLTVGVTRNVTLNEKIFPAIENGKTSPLWNVYGEQHGNKAPNLLPEPIENSLCGNPQIMDDEHSNFFDESASEPDT